MISSERVEELTRKHYKDIYKFCCSHLRDENAAMDVTQDVFLIFINKANELEDICVRSWLYTTASKKIKEDRRNEIIRSQFYSFDDNLNSEVNIPDIILDFEKVLDDDLIEITRNKIISMLTPEEKLIFDSIYEKHMKFSEIGNELGISANAVAARHYRLKNKIAKIAKSAFIVLIFVMIKLKLL